MCILITWGLVCQLYNSVGSLKQEQVISAHPNLFDSQSKDFQIINHWLELVVFSIDFIYKMDGP